MTHPSQVPAPERPFGDLPLPPATLANLEQLGYASMTPIQAASLPLALAGHDLIAQAKTGSGKTAAFALVLLAKLERSTAGVQAVVLCPTRELADQVSTEIRRIARADQNVKVLTLCGGTPIRPQLARLQHGAHVVVGTPGRILDHLKRGSLRLDAVRTLVLDEADRMLDLGFFDDIASVVKRCPAARQTLLFSATYPEGIARLSRQFLREPHEIKLLERPGQAQIHQRFYRVDERERLEVAARLLEHYRPQRTLAFCNTKQRCRDVQAFLAERDIVTLALHGDLEQRDRDQVLVQFANRSCSVLVATDVAARGLDIAQLEAVVNVEITPDPEVHVHRIGRTGRVDQEGWALSLVSAPEMPRVARIEDAQGEPLEWHTVGELGRASRKPLVPPMVTLQILGGRKDKIRPGDVLGALTSAGGFRADQVGKISVNEFATYVAVERTIARAAFEKLSAGQVKGRSVKVHLLRASPG